MAITGSIAGLQGGIAGVGIGVVAQSVSLTGPIIGLVGPNFLGTAGGIVGPWLTSGSSVINILFKFDSTTGSQYLPVLMGFP